MNKDIQSTLGNLEESPFTRSLVILNKEKFIEILSEIVNMNDISSIRNRVFILKDTITNHKKDIKSILNIDAENSISLRGDVFISGLNQILESQTVEEVKYYVERLEKGIFDLKITYPKEYIKKYGANRMLKNNKDLAVWMYENQCVYRFGDNNRLFVVLLDKDNPERS